MTFFLHSHGPYPQFFPLSARLRTLTSGILSIAGFLYWLIVIKRKIQLLLSSSRTVINIFLGIDLPLQVLSATFVMAHAANFVAEQRSDDRFIFACS